MGQRVRAHRRRQESAGGKPPPVPMPTPQTHTHASTYTHSQSHPHAHMPIHSYPHPHPHAHTRTHMPPVSHATSMLRQEEVERNTDAFWRASVLRRDRPWSQTAGRRWSNVHPARAVAPHWYCAGHSAGAPVTNPQPCPRPHRGAAAGRGVGGLYSCATPYTVGPTVKPGRSSPACKRP